MRRVTISDIWFKFIVFLIIFIVFVSTLYPFWNIMIYSINNATDSMKDALYLLPRVFTLASYKTILSDPQIISGFKVTCLRTLIGTPLSLFCITMLAYALSKRDLVGRKFLNIVFIFTMYFSGGLIPLYMVLKALHLIDNFWVFIFPNLINVFYMILVRTFIEDLPISLEEAARIDGANDLQIFFRIVLPLSLPALAAIGLFLAVDNWNSWFDSYAFTYKPSLATLQAVMVKILMQYQTSTGGANGAQIPVKGAVTPDSVRYAASMVATLPIILIYPFLQRYFTKGLMVGAIKD